MQDVKFKVNRHMINVKLEENKEYFKVKFPYSKTLISDVKAMDGARWNPEAKFWTFKNSGRNRFQLSYLKGENPYAPYDLPYECYTLETGGRPAYQHQLDMAKFILTRRQCIIAGEMGTGKTLAAILAMENSGLSVFWWVAPRSAIEAVRYEFAKWNAKVWPTFFTYEGLKNTLKTWSGKAPEGVFFDESQKIKNPVAQRSQAAMHLAESMRAEWGSKAIIVPMSGGPAPKSPGDWWHQCEVACPGFIKEGNIHKFTQRVGLIVQKESVAAGGSYPVLITWYNDAKKCKTCGQLADHTIHVPGFRDDHHPYVQSENEVAKLYQRMKGLVLVKFKKDCLDLPEKVYKVIRLTPSGSILRAAQHIVATSPSVIKALTLLRELSDGFQYAEQESERVPCACPNLDAALGCQLCGGRKYTSTFSRVVKRVNCPKDQLLRDLLDEHDDVSRFVVYAGFQGSVDRVTDICQEEKWEVLRVDGRGWHCSDSSLKTPQDMIKAFQEPNWYDKNLCFNGQPGAGGLGLTLTASPSLFHWSNDFNGDSRWQSDDRIHRPGMDLNRGATIIDCVHLPVDEVVLNKLLTKRDLALMSMGELQDELSKITGERIS